MWSNEDVGPGGALVRSGEPSWRKPDQMPRRSGHVWCVRQATSADAGLIAELVRQVDRDRAPRAIGAEALLPSRGTLRVLLRDGVAVGLCGVEDPQANDRWESRREIEFRMLFLIADGLGEIAAAEAADRLIDELACSVGLPIRSAAFRATLCRGFVL